MVTAQKNEMPIVPAEGRLHLYSLFYVSQKQRNHVNLRSTADDVGIFLGCASLLAKSAMYHGIRFSLITNDIDLARRRLNEIEGGHVDIIGYKFERNVPQDIEFYSAHFKLDLFKAFGSGAFGNWIGLVDMDMVLVRPIPEWVFQKKGFLAYGINDQVFPEYGMERIACDLEQVTGCSINMPTWYGGEFILGQSRDFERLAGYVDSCWPRYLRNIQALHHVGDEMVISSSLALAQQNCELVTDAGSMGLVSRWWTARTRFVQKPLHLASRACVLHLPADKKFLAAQSRRQFHPVEFLSFYKSHARKKLLLRKLYNTSRGVFERERRYVGSIY